MKSWIKILSRFELMAIIIFLAMPAYAGRYRFPTQPLAGVQKHLDAFKVKQLNGAVFMAKRYGNSISGGIETLTGYPITKNAKGYWVYEKRTIQGELVPTNVRANRTLTEFYKRLHQTGGRIGKN